MATRTPRPSTVCEVDALLIPEDCDLSRVRLETYEWIPTDGAPPVYWDVDAAKRILAAAPRPPARAWVAELWAELLATAHPLTWAHVAEVDISTPLIALPAGPGYVLIDGWHRVARARMMGRASLPIWVLTADEAEQVRVADPADPSVLLSRLMARLTDLAITP